MYATVPLDDLGLGCAAHVTRLAPGTAYSFRVVAINSCGASKPSAAGQQNDQWHGQPARRCLPPLLHALLNPRLAGEPLTLAQVSSPQQQLPPVRLAACGLGMQPRPQRCTCAGEPAVTQGAPVQGYEVDMCLAARLRSLPGLQHGQVSQRVAGAPAAWQCRELGMHPPIRRRLSSRPMAADALLVHLP